MGKNINLIYMRDYKELYTGDIEEQLYVSRLLPCNFNIEL